MAHAARSANERHRWSETTKRDWPKLRMNLDAGVGHYWNLLMPDPVLSNVHGVTLCHKIVILKQMEVMHRLIICEYYASIIFCYVDHIYEF